MLTEQDATLVHTLEGLEAILRVGESDTTSNEGVNQVSLLSEDDYGKMLHENIKEPQLSRL